MRWLGRVGIWLAACFLAGAAHAASYDPQMKWRTITTEHFRIHFHQGEEALAEEYSQLVEQVYDNMSDELQWEPRSRIEVVLVDRTDYANGYASVLPYNQIVLFATAPTPDSTLGFYEQWNETLFTHELTHILHMDTNHGIVRATRAVLGRVASTNDLSPPWMIEGFATFQETRHTTGGRGRASIPDMIKRTAVLEDAFPPMGNLDGFQPYPPSGNLRYLFGQDFIQHVSDHYGEDAWTKWVHTYGSSIPYIFALPPIDRDKPLFAARRSFGKHLVPLYFEWRDAVTERYRAQAEQIRADGPVTLGRLVSGGEASCAAPSFSPDGDSLVWSCYDMKTGSAIWIADGEGYARQVLLQDRGATQFTWRADSKAFAYSGVHLVNRFNTWSDIYLHHLDSESTKALTGGARARDPAFSPDGSVLLYVTNRAQQNQLETMRVDQRSSTLTDHDDHTQIATPTFSPDGRSVALSMWQDGRTDLWITDPEGQPVRRVTQDAAIDRDPVWSRDGEWLLFTSDRTGVPNIFAVEVETERLYQVTNVLTGAGRPTIHPSGSRIAYQQYSENGWDVIVLDWEPENFIDRGLLPRPVRYDTALAELTGPVLQPAEADELAAWDEGGRFVHPAGRVTGFEPTDAFGFQNPPSEGLDTFDDQDIEDVYGEEADYPFSIEPTRYSPYRRLLPTFVAPGIVGTTEPAGPTFEPFMPSFYKKGLIGSLSTGSSDPLRHVGWSSFGTFRTDAEGRTDDGRHIQGAFGGGGGITLNRFLPVFSVGGSTRALPRGKVPLVDATTPVDPGGELVVDTQSGPTYWERRDEGYFQVGWPYKLRSSVFANYSFANRRAMFRLPDEAWLPQIPLRGSTGALSAGYRYSWAQQTALAISLEDARIFSLLGSVMHPWLGTSVFDAEGNRGPLTLLQLTSEIREYVVNPLIPNHVFAGRLGAGVTFGANQYLGNYLLGGSFGDSAFYVTPDGSHMLRGYVLGGDIGDMYWTANGEYRFPIWHIQRGVGTVPIYARYLSGAVFVDAGNAFNNPSLSGRSATASELASAAFSTPLVGTGAEIQFSGIYLWSVGITGRGGYAFGLTPHGVRPSGPGLPYFQLGGTF